MKKRQEVLRRGKGSPYPELFRIRVAKEYLAGGVTYQQLATKYSIDRTLIVHWVTNFVRRTNYVSIMKEKPKRKAKSPLSEREQSLMRELSELKRALHSKEKELDKANLHVYALDTMIDVAEEMFDIEIRKKPGAKQ